MPIRVEYRLGSIFDEECDILVIPSSTGGTVTPEIQEALREAGLPLPIAIAWGTIDFRVSLNPRYRTIAFAAAVRGQGSSTEVAGKIGRQLGRAAQVAPTRVSAPLLGIGSGDLRPVDSARALVLGFLAAGPHDGSVLTINVQDLGLLYTVMREYPLPTWQNDRVPPTQAIDIARSPADADQPSALSPGRSSNIGMPKRTRVFISYSHADAPWLERLQKHLRPLEREGALVWDDTRIKAGGQWREEIREALTETKVAILLISADFLASEFITTDELPPLLKTAEEDGATILPVIISPSRFERTESLSRFQAVNDPQKPLVQLRRANRERELDKVARAVEDALRL
jgi:hypothetical protein